MGKIIYIICIYIIMLIPLLFVIAFIDRILPSGKGFSNYDNFLLLSLLIVTNLPIMLLNINKIFSNFLGNSIIFYLLSYHVMALFIINILIVSSIYLIVGIDFLLRDRLKLLKIRIISSKNIPYKLLVKNPKFLKNCLIISYFFSIIVIIFIMPGVIEGTLQYDKEILEKARLEIRLYQQLFVFSTLPILFNCVGAKQK